MPCICPASEEHADLISRIIQESFHEQAKILKLEVDQYPNYAGFETGDRVRMRMRSGDHAFLLYVGDMAVGTVSYQVANAPTAYVKRLGVLPVHRGMEYGRLLMKEAEQGLRSLGIGRIEISIVAQFERLQNYYESMGYRVFDRKTIPAFPFAIAFMNKSLL